MPDDKSRRRARRASRGWWGDTVVIGLIGAVGGIIAGEKALAIASAVVAIASALVLLHLRRQSDAEPPDSN
jgi:galactitol-specific phosphotransferase system IIC component